MNWKHIEDIDNPGDVYLSRLMLIRTRLFGLYFHIIRRPDWSRCQHDHPWPFYHDRPVGRGVGIQNARGQKGAVVPVHALSEGAARFVVRRK